MVGSSLVGWHLVNPSTCFLSYLHNVIKTRTVKTCSTNFLFDLVCTCLAFQHFFSTAIKSIQAVKFQSLVSIIHYMEYIILNLKQIMMEYTCVRMHLLECKTMPNYFCNDEICKLQNDDFSQVMHGGISTNLQLNVFR